MKIEVHTDFFFFGSVYVYRINMYNYSPGWKDLC